MNRSQVINLNSGPPTLPEVALAEAAQGLLNYDGLGIGLTEISHRSPQFGKLKDSFATTIRNLLQVPVTHDILFTQGGASGQFSAIVLNLLARHRLKFPELKEEERTMDYIVTGVWSEKATQEGELLGGAKVNIVTDSRNYSDDGKTFDSIPPVKDWKFSKNPAFVYFCENETVNAVQFDGYPHSSSTPFPFDLVPRDGSDTSLHVPLIADYSSSIFSRPIPNISSYALIFAGAQKNVGPAGLTILIVRKDLLVDTRAAAKLGATPVPTTLDYAVMAKAGSVYHTPPMFSMYVSSLVLKHYEELGGTPSLQKLSEKKTTRIYEALDEGIKVGVFRGSTKLGSRSWMNIVFYVLGEGAETRFLEESHKLGFRGIKGHPTTGGIRVSLYNASTIEQAETLANFMRAFVKKAVDSKSS